MGHAIRGRAWWLGIWMLAGTAGVSAVPSGVEANDWAGIRSAHEQWRHALTATPEGVVGRNPRLGWGLRFDGRGFVVTPEGGGWEWGLTTVGYGFGDGVTTLPASGVGAGQAEGSRLARARDGRFHEWFVNDRRGVQQGFTLAERPAGGAAGQPLRVDLAVRGGLRAQVGSDGRGAQFVDGSGRAVVRYDGLVAWDADGEWFPARMVSAGPDRLRIEVDEGGARYPLHIDPVAQAAYVKPHNPGEDTADQFGTAVAMSSNTLVVGATGEDGGGSGVNPPGNEGEENAGAAYVFVRSGTNWTFQAYLKATNPGSNDLFGAAVAVHGDTVVVGAPNEDGSGTGANPPSSESFVNSGAAYVFVRSGTNWSAQAYLKALDSSPGDTFGSAVAVVSNRVLVGAPLNHAAYVWVRSGTNWTQQARLTNGSTTDAFGGAVALTDDTALIGARNEDGSGTGVNPPENNALAISGAAYVFVRSGTNWTRQAYLKAPNPGTGDWFGWAVALSSNTAVVTAPREDGSGSGVNPASNEGTTNSGAAYVYVRSGTNWAFQAYLKPTNPGAFDEYGRGVGLWDNLVAVGAPYEDGGGFGPNPGSNEASTNSGALYVYSRTGTNWSGQGYLKAWDMLTPMAGSEVGRSVAVWGDYVVGGAPLQDDGRPGINPSITFVDQTATDSGAAYVYLRSGTNWTNSAYAKPQNVGNDAGWDDQFGTAVAVHEDTVVVGSPREDGSGRTVNAPDDNLALDAGAAYVFVRTGGVWSQQAYLKAFNADAGDLFGSSVSVWGNRVVVGAWAEDGGGAGVDPVDGNVLDGSGAAYVFVRDGTNWSHQAYLKALNPGQGDLFGYSVSISHATVAVGARQEDGTGAGVNPVANDGTTNAGAVYVYVRDSGAWAPQAYLKSGNPGANDQFGFAVSVWSNRLAVGSPFEDGGGNGVNAPVNENAANAGAAYVFERTGTNWSGPVYIKAGNSGADDQFGWSVSVWRSTLAVGAPEEDGGGSGFNPPNDNTATNNGAAYVFVRTGTNWAQTGYLKVGGLQDNEHFGTSVGLWEGTLAVGAPYNNWTTNGINFQTNSGLVQVWQRTGTNWAGVAVGEANPLLKDALLGWSVAVWGDTVAAGAPGDKTFGRGVNPDYVGGSEALGAAHLFEGVAVPEIGVRGNGNNIADGDTTPAPGNNTDFGGVLVGGAAAEVFSITNSGTAELVVDNTSVTGDAAGEFAVTVLPPSPVATNDEVFFQVVFTPTNGGLREARIRFENNDLNENPFTFSIQGTGIGPEIGVSGAGTDIADGSTTPTTTNLTDFGAVLVNGSVQRTFIITNTGSTNLAVGTVSVGGANPAAFTVNTQPAASVAAGASTFFRVTFSPSVANVRNATLSFTNGDFNEAPFDFAIRGVGAATALEVWRYNYFGTVTNTGLAANAADPDGDGLRNLMEFALGDNPTWPNADGVTVTNTATQLSLYYPRAAQSSNITLRAWWTTNLLVWATNGITETKLSDDGTNQTWRATVPRSGRPRLFLRLQSTDP